MTPRKANIRLVGERTPSFVDRETGAAELRISPETWDRWVQESRLPPQSPGFPPSTPRWRWVDVDRRLIGDRTDDSSAFIAAAGRLAGGPKKTRGRRAS